MQAIQRQSPSTAPCAIPVAIYTRVSTLHQVGGRFDSCESQAAICRDHIQRHAAQGWSKRRLGSISS
jgi:DNA invertase Pin-like site-specific DNA recombinase